MIAVVAPDLSIGYQGKLCFKIKEDLKHFRNLTMGNTVIMGTGTYMSLPGDHYLGGRRNIVLSRDLETVGDDRVEVFPSLEDALDTCKDERVFIIGGGMLYSYAYSFVDTLNITEAKLIPTFSDTYFPEYREDFICIEREEHDGFDFTEYKRLSVLLGERD